MTQLEITPAPPLTNSYIDIRDLGVGGVPYICVTVFAGDRGPLVTGKGGSVVEAIEDLGVIVRSLPRHMRDRCPQLPQVV